MEWLQGALDTGLALRVVAAFAAGALLGALHFGSLWWAVSLYGSGAPLKAIAAQLLRFAILGAALFAIAMEGALPLIAAGLGLLAARAIVVRRVRRAL